MARGPARPRGPRRAGTGARAEGSLRSILQFFFFDEGKGTFTFFSLSERSWLSLSVLSLRTLFVLSLSLSLFPMARLQALRSALRSLSQQSLRQGGGAAAAAGAGAGGAAAASSGNSGAAGAMALAGAQQVKRFLFVSPCLRLRFTTLRGRCSNRRERSCGR